MFRGSQKALYLALNSLFYAVAKERSFINSGDDLPSLPTGVFITTPTPRELNGPMNITVNSPFRRTGGKRQTPAGGSV
jgi:hypothetical protein